MFHRVLLIFMCLVLIGCQPSAAPSRPSSAPQTSTPVSTERSQWVLGLQSWEAGTLTDEVSLKGSTVEMLSGKTYEIPDAGWSAPPLEGWSTDKPEQGQYLAFNDKAGAEHYLPAGKNQELADKLGALKPTAFAYGPGYAWVSGRLEHSDLEGGTWTLVYSEKPGDDDPHGGKFVIQGAIPEGIKAGETVVVFGSIAEAQMGINMAGTYYEAREISKSTD
jgi:hypothetical protein